MGSAALYHLARRGKRVLGLERFDLLHEQGSSHGLTRIIRLAYFEHPDYVPLLRRAYELWRELESEAGEQLLHVTGIVEGGERILDGVLRSCAEHDLEHEVLSGAEVTRRFPAYRLPAEMEVAYQPDGGFVVPERCIVAHVQGALARGAVLRARERVLEWEETESGVRIRTDRGCRRGRAARADRRRVVAGRGATPGRNGARGAPVARVAAADASRAVRARPHARLQPRARRRALLRLPRARHPRASSSAATTTSARAATRTRSTASPPSRTRRRFAPSPSATSPKAPGRPWRSRRASSNPHPTSTSSSTATRTHPQRSSAPASRDTATSSARSSARSSPTSPSTARRATTSGCFASTGSDRRRLRAGGLEPPRAEAQRVLSPSRLPVPPRPRECKCRGEMLSPRPRQ